MNFGTDIDYNTLRKKISYNSSRKKVNKRSNPGRFSGRDFEIIIIFVYKWLLLFLIIVSIINA